MVKVFEGKTRKVFEKTMSKMVKTQNSNLEIEIPKSTCGKNESESHVGFRFWENHEKVLA